MNYWTLEKNNVYKTADGGFPEVSTSTETIRKPDFSFYTVICDDVTSYRCCGDREYPRKYDKRA